MNINYNKLLQAIELVAYNRLDECRDDTLIEKLVTVFDSSFSNSNCTNQQLNAIFSLCKQSINKWSYDKSKVFIGPVFSFVFKLLSSIEVQNAIDQKVMALQLKKLIDLKKEVFNCDYSIQSYYVKGLIKLCSSKDGSRLLFEERLVDEQLIDDLISYGLNCKSFFVKEAIQQCLVEILRKSSELNDDDGLLIKFFRLIILSFELRLNKFQIKIIGQLLLDGELKLRIFKSFPDLNQKLISHINCQIEENINLQLIELLANCLDDESQINFVFIKLIKNSLLRPLITFSTNLALRNSTYLNKWFTYVVLPLQIDYESNEINSNLFSYSEFDKNFIKSLTNERSLIYCLHYLKIKFPKQLTDRQLNEVFEIIENFILNLIKQSKIKLLRESILMIGNLSKQFNRLDPKLFGILIDLLVSLLELEPFQCECLIWLRHLFANEFENSQQLIENENLKRKLSNLLQRIINLELKDENLDVIDGGLELIDTLIRHNYLKLSKLDNSILKSIFNIWNHSIDHSDNYSLKASCISILFNLHLQLDKETKDRLLNEMHISEDNNNSSYKLYNKTANISEILWKCLKDENSLVRKKVIESIKESIMAKDCIKDEMIDKLAGEDRLYLNVCYHLSESVLFDIDADIQLASINFLKNLIINFVDKDLTDKLSKDEMLKIKINGLIYFVHCLHFTILNNLTCFTVKEECLNVLQEIKNCLDKNLLKKADLISILKNDESVFEYQIDSYGKEEEKSVNNLNDESNRRRDEQLNEMFKDNLFRTEEIIEQFTSKRVESAVCNSRDSNLTQTSITNKMNKKQLIEFLFTFNANTCLNNEIKVDFLDDILAARANDDLIIDCY